MPTNRAGTCGHVALAMMLTYLETFWNDFFVEERFEAHSSLEIPDILWTITPQMEFRSGGTPSPGCFDDIDNTYLTQGEIEEEAAALAQSSGMSVSYHIDEICLEEAKRSAQEGSLQGYLFQTAIENGVVSSSYRDGYMPWLSIGAGEQAALLNLILERNGLSEQWTVIHPGRPTMAVEVEGRLENRLVVESMQEYREEVASLLSAGFPVIVQGYNWSQTDISNIHQGTINPSSFTPYHSAVAYGFDSEENMIGNMGWKGSQRESNFDEWFNLGFDDYVAIMPKEGWEHIHSDNYRVDDDDLDQVVSWCPCDTEMIVREESVPDLELIDLEVGDNWYGFDIDGNFTCKFDGTGWGIKDGGVIVSPVKTSESSMTRVSDFMFCVEENAYRIDLLGQIDFFLYDDVVITGIFGAAPVNSDDEIQGFPYSISSSSILTDRWGDVARDGWDTGLSLTATNESQGPFGIMLEAALIMFPAIPVEPVQIAIDSFKVMEIAP